MTIIQALKKTRTLLRKGWCQGNYARNPFGMSTSLWDPDACSWCLTGAILRSCEDNSLSYEVHKVLARITPRKFGTMKDVHNKLSSWNDHDGRTKEEVIKLVSRAITRLER
jgi:hypothetical protein